jgi:hypothetical protein
VLDPWSVVERYRTTAGSIQARVGAALAKLWSPMALDPSDEAASLFGRNAHAVSEAGQRLIGAATDQYLADLATTVTGQVTRPLGVPTWLTSTLNLRGIPGEAVWSRPGRAVWAALGKGAAMPDALRAGLFRADDLGSTGLQLSHTRSALFVLGGGVLTAAITPGPVHLAIAAAVLGDEGKDRDRRAGNRLRAEVYRRSPRRGACDLCQSTARTGYATTQAMPIHTHCHCVAVPVIGRWDPAGGIPDVAPGASRPDVVVREHGEMGPVLTYAGHNFKGPEDLAN